MGDKTESSPIGIADIIVRVIVVLFCIGAVVSAAITLTTIEDRFPDDLPDDSDAAVDRDAYRGAAGWLVFIAGACIIFQGIMIILRGLYFGGVLQSGFVAFAVVNAVFCILFALGLLAGGISSAANAANVQNDYYEALRCDEISDDLPDDHPVVEICDDYERLRNSQAAGGAMGLLSAIASIVLTVLMIVSAVKKRKETV